VCHCMYSLPVAWVLRHFNYGRWSGTVAEHLPFTQVRHRFRIPEDL
jgi:hypothetical protein